MSSPAQEEAAEAMAGAIRAVFLSYRREETRHVAGRLADRLTDRLGPGQVFMDVDTIEPGADFATAIAREVASCRILIALIGPTWATTTDRQQRRRLDDSDDFVVLEIRAALERGIPIIPVLVDGAMMPDRGALPEALQDLARRNAVRLDHDTFRSDLPVLLAAVDQFLSTPPGLSRSGLDREAEQSAGQSLDVLEQLQGWQETPVLFWQSIPSYPAQVLPGLHSSEGIRGGLRNQRVLRPSGFNFEDRLGSLRVYEGGLLLSRGRCALWVRPDGVMTAGVVATPEMLCWAMEQHGRSQRINVRVLSEMTLEYFRLSDELVVPRVPGAWWHRVFARRFLGEQPRALGPGGTEPTLFLSDESPASADYWDRSWSAVGDPERDAFAALQMIYTLFGVDVATNPHVENDRVLTRRLQDD